MEQQSTQQQQNLNYCPEIQMKRHQLIPIQIDDSDKSFEKLQNFILEKVLQDSELKKQNDNKSCIEIEAKLGRFVFNNTEHFKSYNILKQVSRNNIVILSDFKDIPYRFESSVEKQIFDSFQNYMDLIQLQLNAMNENKQQINPQEFYSKLLPAQVLQNKEAFGENPLFEDIIVDFILNIKENTTNGIKKEQKNQRVSFSYSNQKFTQISKNKSKKDSIDLTHNEIQFRISAATETTAENTQQGLVQHLVNNINNIQQIRVKQRKSLRFELFQFDSSKVITIEKKHTNKMAEIKKTLSDIYLDDEIILDSLNMLIQSMVLDSSQQALGAKYEIELEIVDLGYILTFVEGQRIYEIQSLIKRFIRNIESVVYIQRLLQKHLQQGVIPVIGQYLMEKSSII